MRRALVLVHAPVPGPGEHNVGTVGPALREQGLDVVVGSLVAGSAPVPAPDEIDVLVVLGSSEAAYDDTVPWLAGERAYLRRAFDAGVAVLGICFGAQLLARELGGTVARALRPERGFVTLTSDDPAILPAGTWMEFHYDAFTLPPGATALARNDVGLQAFVSGPHLGVQFHPEITPDVLAAWRAARSAEAAAAVAREIDVVALVAEVDARASAGAAACRDLVARFCARAKGEDAAREGVQVAGTPDLMTQVETGQGTRRPVRQLVAASIGNAVEWYDWYAYTFLATYFSGQIFPGNAGDPLVPLLSAFAVFAVGFFLRPVGGLLLGSVADRVGRRGALTVTILMMGAGSLLMAVLPTYASAGLLAPTLLVLARLLQGLSIGGEFAASTTFLVESAPPHRRGLFSSFQYVSTTAGQLVASALAAVLASTLGKPDMTAWGWRVPFAVGAVIALVGFWIRRGAEETHPARDELEAGHRPGLFEALRHYPRASLLVAGVTVAGTVTYYTWTTYFPTYAQTAAGVPAPEALMVSTIALAFFGLLQPLGGMLSDRIGRKPVLIVFAAGFAVGVVPLLALVSSTFAVLLLVQCVGMVLLTGYTSIAAALNAELVPGRIRASGIGFPYSLTVALFGGTAPYLATWLASHGHRGLFGWYVAALALVGLVVYIRLPETAHRPLV